MLKLNFFFTHHLKPDFFLQRIEDHFFNSFLIFRVEARFFFYLQG